MNEAVREEFSMPQMNKAAVVAGPRPGALCQHPRKECRECGWSLGLSPEYGWLSVRGAGKMGRLGLTVFDSCCAGVGRAGSSLHLLYAGQLRFTGSQPEGRRGLDLFPS